MKLITELRKVKPYYFVCIYGEVLFESYSVTECKNYLCEYIKTHHINKDELYDFYIGMFSISLF